MNQLTYEVHDNRGEQEHIGTLRTTSLLDRGDNIDLDGIFYKVMNVIRRFKRLDNGAGYVEIVGILFVQPSAQQKVTWFLKVYRRLKLPERYS